MGKLKDDSKTMQRSCDKVPKGWKTTLQWAEEEGMPVSTASHKIIDLFRAGKWEMKKFRVLSPSGNRSYMTPHYRPKQ